jgi:hypothetical protein
VGWLKLDAKRLAKFKAAVDACEFVKHDYINPLLEKCGIVNGLATMEQSKKFSKQYPEFSRDTGAGILPLILKKGGLKLVNDKESLGKDTWCEFVYVLDLDKKVLEVHSTWNFKKIAKNRFPAFNFIAKTPFKGAAKKLKSLQKEYDKKDQDE